MKRLPFGTRVLLVVLTVLLVLIASQCTIPTSSSTPTPTPSPSPTPTPTPTTTTHYFLYATSSTGVGLYGYEIDPSSGALTPLTALSGNPYGTLDESQAVVSAPKGGFLYATGAASDVVQAYSIDPATGALTEIGTALPTGGNPVAATIDPAGEFLYVANLDSTSGNSVSAYTIDAVTGALKAVTGSPFSTGSGSQPSGLAVAPDEAHLYVATSGTGTGTVTILPIDPSTGALGALTSVASGGVSYPVDLAIDPNGPYLYTLNSNGKLGGYAISAADGSLTSLSGTGAPFPPATSPIAPQTLTVAASSSYIYVPDKQADDLYGFTIDPTTGVPTSMSTTYPTASGSHPWFAAVDPTGKYLYVADSGTNDIAGFSIDTSNKGALTSLGTPMPAGTAPTGLAVVTTTATTP